MALAVSEVNLIYNNQYAKVAHFGMACPWSLQHIVMRGDQIGNILVYQAVKSCQCEAEVLVAGNSVDESLMVFSHVECLLSSSGHELVSKTSVVHHHSSVYLDEDGNCNG